MNNVNHGINKLSSESLPSWKSYFEYNEGFIDSQGNQFNTFYTPPSSPEAPVFVCHHGAGSSGLTFALLAQQLKEQMKQEQTSPGVFAFDARGHGQTKVVSNPGDYSIDAFVTDFVFILKHLIEIKSLTSNPIIVIGHSLGGSILANSMSQLKELEIKGIAMFDIVEDTAIQSLDGMELYLTKLPKSFSSLSSAIDWHLKMGLLRNKASAEISVPPLFKLVNGKYKWITNLWDTQSYWKEWFIGLSDKFIGAYPAKLLILAGTETLDKQLIIGQMQGKYQLVVFQDSGHFLHEDSPKKTAITLIDFWKRNDKKQVVIKTNWGMKK